MLTNPPVLSDTNPVIAKSMAGFSIPQNKSAPALIRSAFLCTFINGGLCGSVFGCAVLLFGNANLTQPATLLFSINGGSSRTKQEYTIMALVHPYPVDEVITPVDRALSVISLLQISSEHQQLNIQGVTAQNLLWVVQNELEAAQQANDSWSRLGEGE